MIYLICLAAFTCTMLGGLFALRLRDRLHLVLGFSAGVVIGVAFFDLIPEAFEIIGSVYEPSVVTTIMAIGFVTYLLIDRLLLAHAHVDDDDQAAGQSLAHNNRGYFGAGSISFHSFLDGMGIGFAFQVSSNLGAVVAIAVLLHNFSDGINTVSMIVKNGGDRRTAVRWLIIDAMAPVLGIVFASLFTISEITLGLLLALFAGFFLYIGASDLLPESHHSHPVRWTTFSTIFGIALMYLVINLSGL